MYFPLWVLIIVLMVGIYYFIRSKKKQNLHSNEIKNDVPKNFLTNKFSYKFDIDIEPSWFRLYKKASGIKSEKQLLKEIKEKKKKSEDQDSNLYGRRYYFTEYFDSETGLTTRFQRVFLPSGKEIFYPVDEFGDRGYFFECDMGLNDETDKKREKRQNLSIDIGESYIRNSIFDKYIGGLRSDSDYEEKNYLFTFPLYDMFNFLFALGQRFHDTETNTIIKWPDSIEKEFNELQIKYDTYFDYEPSVFNIEEYDKEFFEKWGKPKISSSSSYHESGFLRSEEDGTSFGVSLKIFRPGENDRISQYQQT